MRLVVFHRVTHATAMRLNQERLKRLAEGEAVLMPPTVFTTEFGTPLPVEILSFARVDDSGTKGVLNLTGLGTLPGFDDELGKTRCPQLIRTVTIYEQGVDAKLQSLLWKGLGIESTESLLATRRYTLYQPNECAVLESADVTCTLEEVQQILSECRLKEQQLLHNATTLEEQRAFRTAVKVEVERLQILMEQCREQRVQEAAEHEKRAQEGLRTLKGWGLVHGSEKLRLRIDGGFSWAPLAGVEWARSICTPLVERGYVEVKHGKGVQVEMRTTPTTEQMRELRTVQDLLGPAGEIILDSGTTLVWVTTPDDECGSKKETQLQVTVLLPNQEFKSLYFRIKSPENGG